MNSWQELHIIGGLLVAHPGTYEWVRLQLEILDEKPLEYATGEGLRLLPESSAYKYLGYYANTQRVVYSNLHPTILALLERFGDTDDGLDELISALKPMDRETLNRLMTEDIEKACSTRITTCEVEMKRILQTERDHLEGEHDRYCGYNADHQEPDWNEMGFEELAKQSEICGW